MSDYVNTFNGTSKDNNSDTILGAEWDTEYDNIETMSQTKADEAIGAVSGNMIELNASGEIVDSGISSINLDGVSGVIETRLDDLETGLPAITPNQSAPTNWLRVGTFLFPDGSQNNSVFSWPAAAEGVWQTVGDSSHPTSDWNWNVLDDFDTGYEITHLLVGGFVSVEDTSISTGYFDGRMGPVAPVIIGSDATNVFALEVAAISDSIRLRTFQAVWVPVTYDGNGISFKVRWVDFTLSTTSCYMNLMGVKDDSA